MSTKTTYSEKLRDPRWQQKRLSIMQRDCWQCRACGDKKSTLNIHHLKYNGNPWEASDNDLLTVCESCHGVFEFIKKSYNGIPVNKVHWLPSESGIRYCFAIHEMGVSVGISSSVGFSEMILLSPYEAKNFMHFLINSYINNDLDEPESFATNTLFGDLGDHLKQKEAEEKKQLSSLAEIRKNFKP